MLLVADDLRVLHAVFNHLHLWLCRYLRLPHVLRDEVRGRWTSLLVTLLDRVHFDLVAYLPHLFLRQKLLEVLTIDIGGCVTEGFYRLPVGHLGQLRHDRLVVARQGVELRRNADYLRLQAA